jgi:hypothetical protein
VSGVTVTANQITATFGLAAGVSGPQNISVTTPGGTSNSLVFTINALTGPTLASISPTSGVVNTATPVTITGLGLTGGTLNAPAGISVTNIVVASDTLITATFTGLSFGPQAFTVTTGAGTSNALTFLVTPPPPSITSITPASGTSGTSVGVTIAGVNLTGATLTVPAVITATAVTVADTQITANFALAPGVSGPQTVTVTTAGGTANTTFTISAPLAPTLSTIAPTSGAQGTSVPVTLTGLNLTGVTALNTPAGISASQLVVVSDTSITATLAITATAATGPQDITVTGPGGASNALKFTVNPPAPVLSTLSSTSGAVGATVNMTLTGSNLSGAAVNAITGITVSVTNTTATSVSASFAIAANATPGPQSVSVTTGGGTSNALTFTITPPAPTLTNISPVSGVTGTVVPVTLTGTFLTGATVGSSANLVVSGVTVVSDTQITATLSLGAAGAGNVSVTTAGGTANIPFTVLPPAPALSTISPASGVLGAAVNVTLLGTNLTGATINAITGVTISGVTSTATSVSATFTIAAATTTGTRNVSVTTAGGTSAPIGFTINPPAPTLTSITPASGAQGAAVNVTLAGTNLTGATINPIPGITISGVTTTPNSISATFTIGAAATTGAQTVTVNNVTGASNGVTFTITVPGPIITGVSPGTLPVGTTTVTISGFNFLSGSTVKLTPGAGVSVGTATVVNANTITVPVTVAANAKAGTRSLSVTSGGITSGTVNITVQ